MSILNCLNLTGNIKSAIMDFSSDVATVALLELERKSEQI